MTTARLFTQRQLCSVAKATATESHANQSTLVIYQSSFLCLNSRLRVFLHIRRFSWVISLFNGHSLSTRASSPPLPSFYVPSLPPSVRARSLARSRSLSTSSAASVRSLFLFSPSSSPLVSALILPCPSPFICSYPLLHLSVSSFFVSPSSIRTRPSPRPFLVF